MKRIVLSLVLASTVIGAFAQNYESSKNLLALNQVRKAKEEVDKGMTNAKYNSKPEAYILKASVYAMLALDPTVKGTPEALTLTKEAEEALA